MTDSIVDLRYLAESQPSLCIPRVFNNIDETRLRRVFDELELGKIHHIDIIVRKNDKGEAFKRVYIHFEKWSWNENAQAARRKLISGKEIKIVYDNPWFWKVSANKWTPSNDRRVEGPRARPHIEFDDSPKRSREVDEFGRNNVMRKEYESRKPENKGRPENKKLENKGRPENKKQENKKLENLRLEIPIEQIIPSSPDCSPPRQRIGSTITFPPAKKRTPLKKKAIVIHDKKAVILEEQIEEQVDEQVEEKEESEEDNKRADELYGDLV
jgi:hypothetical protein